MNIIEPVAKCCPDDPDCSGPCTDCGASCHPYISCDAAAGIRTGRRFAEPPPRKDFWGAEPQTEARSALEQAQAGTLPNRPYHFLFMDDVLVDVRESEEGRITREYTDPKMAQEARKRLREAQAAEALPEGTHLNRRARRGILARAKAHIRKKGREMYLRGKKQERQALKGGQ